jgi:putative aldouronate transport system permease protein
MRTNSEKIFNVANTLFMIFLCIITVYPYINQLAIAFNEGLDTSFGGITIYPRIFTLSNFKLVFANHQIWGASVISSSRVLIGTLSALMMTTAAAYGLSKDYLPGKKIIMNFFILPSYISLGMIPAFILFKHYGLINNYLIYIVPRLFSFYNMIIIMSFIRSLPKELDESAIIDGANDIQVFYKITIPLSMPVLATVALWLSVEHWNDWVTTLMYITDKKLYPLQFLLLLIVKESETLQSIISEVAMSGGNTADIAVPTPEAIRATTFIVVTMPIILVYPFLQKYFVKGVTLGAVKG